MKMYMRCLRYVVRKPAFTHFSSCSARYYSTTKTSKPLRILFCGSEEFSAASLKALHEEQIQNPGLIQSIDVLIRPGKPFGRNFKTIREVPLKTTASLLGLKVYERDTFTGWDLPKAKGGPINLIIAVSFGLFVPPRILNSVEYGGLNVHPSLLPEFRGPAPLQYSIMHGLPKTGVTLQTLDPKAFDQGTILAQSLSIPIPNYKTTTYGELRDFLAPKAAEMLIQVLRDRAFVPPLQDVGWYKSTKPIHAYKISAADKEIKWHEWTSVMVDRQYRAVGRLWNNIRVNIVEKKHVLFDNFEVVPKPAIFKEWIHGRKYDEKTGHLLPQKSDEQVRFFVYEAEGNKVMAQMYIEDGEAIILCCGMDRVDCVKVRRMTVGGESSKPAAQVTRQFKGRELWQLIRGARNVGGMSAQPREELTIRKYVSRKEIEAI